MNEKTGPNGIEDAESPDAGAEQAPLDENALSPEQAEELVATVRSGGLDVPVGAEDFAEALRLVAAQRDEYLERLQRTAADFQNFQRRARQTEREARELASAGVIQSLIPVLDFFDMALKQNPETATAAQVIGGVQMIKSEFVRVLGAQGVGVIAPGRGDAFDPMRHEAIEHVAGGGVAPDHIVDLRTPGYTFGERVIRPAKVTVANESDAVADAEG